MAERTITMGSYSKTFAITGWRIGYLVSPPDFSELLRTIADQIFVCPPTPLQHGVAHGIRALPASFYEEQREKYTRKRSILCDALARAGLTPSIPQGAYYVIADTTQRFPNMTSEEAVHELLRSANVAGVPASDFLGPEVKGDPRRSTFIRFMFSVEDAVLEQAADNLIRSIS
jgi:aminotransferase